MKTRRQKVFSILVACLLCASLFCVPVSAEDDVISIDISNMQSDARMIYTSDRNEHPDFSDLSKFDSAEIVKDTDSYSFTIPSSSPPTPLCCFLSFNLIDSISVNPNYFAQILSGSFTLTLLDNSSFLLSVYVCLFDSEYNLLGLSQVDPSNFNLVRPFTFHFDNLSIPITSSGDVSYVGLGFYLNSNPQNSHSFDVVFSDIYMNFKLVAMESFLSQVGIFFSQSLDWLGDVFSVIVSTPALLIFILAFIICGFAIGLLDRMKNTR